MSAHHGFCSICAEMLRLATDARPFDALHGVTYMLHLRALAQIPGNEAPRKPFKAKM
jgi:hypothetical protein